jgi:rhodanese-related sulfurtransferase
MSWQTIAIAAAVLAVAGFYAYSYFNSRLTEPQIEAIRRSLAAGARLLDVRTAREFASGHIEGAINIPVSELPRKLQRLGRKRDRPLVIYCRSGSRSRGAAAFLQQQGYSNVLDMKAMTNWRIVRSERAAAM